MFTKKERKKAKSASTKQERNLLNQKKKQKASRQKRKKHIRKQSQIARVSIDLSNINPSAIKAFIYAVSKSQVNRNKEALSIASKLNSKFSCFDIRSDTISLKSGFSFVRVYKDSSGDMQAFSIGKAKRVRMRGEVGGKDGDVFLCVSLKSRPVFLAKVYSFLKLGLFTRVDSKDPMFKGMPKDDLASKVGASMLGKKIPLFLRLNEDLPLIASYKNTSTLKTDTLVVLSKANNILEALGSLEDEDTDCLFAMSLFDLYHPKFDASSVFNVHELQDAKARYKASAFSKEALKEADSMAKSLACKEGLSLARFSKLYLKKPLDLKQRYDLRTLPFCSIDPLGAKDVDDAFYYDAKHATLYVAIADVSEFVPNFSKLYDEAKTKGFSMYFGDEVFPMLPQVLSSEACSLHSGVDRLAFVWEIRLNKRTLKILDSRLFKAVIRSKLKTDYDSVFDVLSFSPLSAKLTKKGRFKPKKIVSIKVRESKLLNSQSFSSIKDFQALSVKLRKKRLKTGFNFDLHGKNFSYHMIEEAMLLANIEAAKLLAKLPNAIFRTHNVMESKKLKVLEKDLQLLGLKKTNSSDTLKMLKSFQEEALDKGLGDLVDTLIIRSMPRAIYDVALRPHFALGFLAYTHFTSPIRRFSDLLVHKILSSYIYDDGIMGSVFAKTEILSTLEFLNMQNYTIKLASREFTNIKLARKARALLGSQSELDSMFANLEVLKERLKALEVKACEEEAGEETLKAELEKVHLKLEKLKTKIKLTKVKLKDVNNLELDVIVLEKLNLEKLPSSLLELQEKSLEALEPKDLASLKDFKAYKTYCKDGELKDANITLFSQDDLEFFSTYKARVIESNIFTREIKAYLVSNP
ncbi:ribonuclease catalytic domain-containing protein [Helicobacter sp. 11S02629-2]|uniref:ribonuclease catalytic domain-containing protein n=1 Tax=Helicobacter sp. 11S02629-2 TaxID=1476195 RepID=UPI000BA7B211|nr:ribonuclease catalytic domain-containing protein [Helicobacter sp. 11S02629-2]PAF46074.1 hypothetical protein BKH40_01315 [Helicobacter sp. 11S02629-2]